MSQMRLRAIVVDGDTERADRYAGMLQTAGHQVLAIGHDGIWAVTFCKKLTPDLLIVDSGISALSAEKVVSAGRRDKTVKLAIVTSKVSRGPIGGDYTAMYIPHPLSPEVIESTLYTMVSMANAKMPEWGLSKIGQLPKRFK